jgi:hypothetical protein
VTKTMEVIVREQARLIILKALVDQVNESMNSDLLVHQLATFGIDKDRDWVHDQLTWLAEMGAIRVLGAGTIKVAILTEKGARHLRRAIVIKGIQRPSRPEE